MSSDDETDERERLRSECERPRFEGQWMGMSPPGHDPVGGTIVLLLVTLAIVIVLLVL